MSRNDLLVTQGNHGNPMRWPQAQKNSRGKWLKTQNQSLIESPHDGLQEQRKTWEVKSRYHMKWKEKKKRKNSISNRKQSKSIAWVISKGMDFNKAVLNLIKAEELSKRWHQSKSNWMKILKSQLWLWHTKNTLQIITSYLKQWNRTIHKVLICQR